MLKFLFYALFFPLTLVTDLHHSLIYALQISGLMPFHKDAFYYATLLFSIYRSILIYALLSLNHSFS